MLNEGGGWNCFWKDSVELGKFIRVRPLLFKLVGHTGRLGVIILVARRQRAPTHNYKPSI